MYGPSGVRAAVLKSLIHGQIKTCLDLFRLIDWLIAIDDELVTKDRKVHALLKFTVAQMENFDKSMKMDRS